MTANKRFKRLVRQRAAKTGESYTAALRHFRTDPGGEAPMVACSFCGKSKTEVGKLVVGPGVSICDGCVGLCADVIAQVREEPQADAGAGPRAAHPAPDRLLEWLPSWDRTLRSIESDLAGRVAVLREQGVSWDRIGEAFGVSAAEAQTRFAPST